jgi:hypothetical protein
MRPFLNIITMRIIVFAAIVFFSGCMEKKGAGNVDLKDSMQTGTSSALKAKPEQSARKDIYENARFRNVVVREIQKDVYRVSGEGQIFEASFNWIVEDGHHETDSGYVTTDAGAPAWGKFDFEIRLKPASPNTIRHLVLFEISAEDGRRVYELPILLN